ncbi:MAG: GlcG/HbpS family heme-binding protein [Xanthobacteraceae bacterium]
MSPISKATVALFAAAALSSPAGAQGVLTQKNVSLPLAQEIAQAAIAKCRTMGYKISVSVLDRDGIPIVMLHDDGAGLSTNEGSDRKAYTAAAFKQPSAAFVKRLQDRPDTIGSRHYTRVLALAGGLPIKVGNDVIGAVGVSGTPGKDDVCAQAGLDRVADQLK